MHFVKAKTILNAQNGMNLYRGRHAPEVFLFGKPPDKDSDPGNTRTEGRGSDRGEAACSPSGYAEH